MSKILVVDDDEFVRESVCAVLNVAGYDTVEATNGEEGITLIEKEAPDLAIVDIWMPKVDGLTLLRRVRAENSDLPIIIVSGGGPGETLERATAIADIYNADHVLFKPFEDTELLEMIEKLLECDQA
ncbi:response regulator [Pelagibius sp. Alg239-R121]|uniref:response regulator n=1 Tax=Pelagibius sp. Alg239-R121 TaxID=2993448 RepID=UPI0024A6443F|nr:response regulator [Pelagibius sp. Alg239-R121]